MLDVKPGDVLEYLYVGDDLVAVCGPVRISDGRYVNGEMVFDVTQEILRVPHHLINGSGQPSPNKPSTPAAEAGMQS